MRQKRGGGCKGSLGQGKEGERLNMIDRLAIVVALCCLLLLSSCATEPKPQHRAERKWYQGTMDSEERAFFVDSFFDGR